MTNNKKLLELFWNENPSLSREDVIVYRSLVPFTKDSLPSIESDSHIDQTIQPLNYWETESDHDGLLGNLREGTNPPYPTELENFRLCVGDSNLTHYFMLSDKEKTVFSRLIVVEKEKEVKYFEPLKKSENYTETELPEGTAYIRVSQKHDVAFRNFSRKKLGYATIDLEEFNIRLAKPRIDDYLTNSVTVMPGSKNMVPNSINYNDSQIDQYWQNRNPGVHRFMNTSEDTEAGWQVNSPTEMSPWYVPSTTGYNLTNILYHEKDHRVYYDTLMKAVMPGGAYDIQEGSTEEWFEEFMVESQNRIPHYIISLNGLDIFPKTLEYDPANYTDTEDPEEFVFECSFLHRNVLQDPEISHLYGYELEALDLNHKSLGPIGPVSTGIGPVFSVNRSTKTLRQYNYITVEPDEISEYSFEFFSIVEDPQDPDGEAVLEIPAVNNLLEITHEEGGAEISGEVKVKLTRNFELNSNYGVSFTREAFYTSETSLGSKLSFTPVSLKIGNNDPVEFGDTYGSVGYSLVNLGVLNGVKTVGGVLTFKESIPADEDIEILFSYQSSELYQPVEEQTTLELFRTSMSIIPWGMDSMSPLLVNQNCTSDTLVISRSLSDNQEAKDAKVFFGPMELDETLGIPFASGDSAADEHKFYDSSYEITEKIDIFDTYDRSAGLTRPSNFGWDATDSLKLVIEPMSGRVIEAGSVIEITTVGSRSSEFALHNVTLTPTGGNMQSHIGSVTSNQVIFPVGSFYQTIISIPITTAITEKRTLLLEPSVPGLTSGAYSFYVYDDTGTNSLFKIKKPSSVDIYNLWYSEFTTGDDRRSGDYVASNNRYFFSEDWLIDYSVNVTDLSTDVDLGEFKLRGSSNISLPVYLDLESDVQPEATMYLKLKTNAGTANRSKISIRCADNGLDGTDTLQDFDQTFEDVFDFSVIAQDVSHLLVEYTDYNWPEFFVKSLKDDCSIVEIRVKFKDSLEPLLKRIIYDRLYGIPFNITVCNKNSNYSGDNYSDLVIGGFFVEPKPLL